MIVQQGYTSIWTPEKVGLLTGVLTLVQLTFVHFMQGSPGAVFVGLKVQYCDGSKPNVTTTLFRAIPYLLVVAFLVAMKPTGIERYHGPLTKIYLVVLVFLAANGATMLVNGRRSLIDMLTKTEVVKAYKVG